MAAKKKNRIPEMSGYLLYIWAIFWDFFLALLAVLGFIPGIGILTELVVTLVFMPTIIIFNFAIMKALGVTILEKKFARKAVALIALPAFTALFGAIPLIGPLVIILVPEQFFSWWWIIRIVRKEDKEYNEEQEKNEQKRNKAIQEAAAAAAT